MRTREHLFHSARNYSQIYSLDSDGPGKSLLLDLAEQPLKQADRPAEVVRQAAEPLQPAAFPGVLLLAGGRADGGLEASGSEVQAFERGIAASEIGLADQGLQQVALDDRRGFLGL